MVALACNTPVRAKTGTGEAEIFAAPTHADLMHRRSVLLKASVAAYAAAGDTMHALSAAEENLVIARQLRSKLPRDAGAQAEIPGSLILVGDTKLQASDLSGAMAAYQEGLEACRQLMSDYPSIGANGRHVRSLILERIGTVRSQMNDRVAALNILRESVDLYRELLKEDPDNSDMQSDLARCLDKIGTLKLKTGDRAGARSAYRDSLEIYRKLSARDPENAGRRWDIFIELINIGDLEKSAGDKTSALNFYREGLDIARIQAKRDGASTATQSDLATSLDRMSDIKTETGDTAAALEAAQKGLDIRTAIAELDPNSRTAKRICFSASTVSAV